MDPIRQNLRDAIVARKTSAIAMSKQIGRNSSFVAQYLAGRVSKLGEDDRLRLAMALEIDERLLGAREPWVPSGAPAVTLPGRRELDDRFPSVEARAA